MNKLSLLIALGILGAQDVNSACLKRANIEPVVVNTLPAFAGTKPITIYHSLDSDSFKEMDTFTFDEKKEILTERSGMTTKRHTMKLHSVAVLDKNGDELPEKLFFWGSTDANRSLYILYSHTDFCESDKMLGDGNAACKYYNLERFKINSSAIRPDDDAAQWLETCSGVGTEPQVGGGTEPP